MCFFSSACPVCPMFGSVAEAMKINFDYFTRTIQSGNEKVARSNPCPQLWIWCSAPACLLPSRLCVDPMITGLQSKYYPKWKLFLIIMLTWVPPSGTLYFWGAEFYSQCPAKLTEALLHSFFSFYSRSKMLVPTDIYCHFPRFTSLWLCLLQCTLCIANLNGTQFVVPLGHLIWIVGDLAWVQLWSHFTFHRLRIITVSNTCLFLTAYSLGSLSHFTWDYEDREIIWTILIINYF